MAFGFDNGFWRKAVIVDPWPLSVLVFCIALVLLLRWFHAPDQRRWLYAAFFAYGLALSNSQVLFAAAFGLQVLIMFGEPTLCREICFVNSLLFVVDILASYLGLLPLLDSHARQNNLLRFIFWGVGASSIALWVWLAFKTRRFFTEWKTVFMMGAIFLLGVSLYLYAPIASMTNPPVNWSYPRTAEGFWHLVTRGQYESLQPTDSFDHFTGQLRLYGKFAVYDFGLMYVVVALVPFCLLHKMSSRERGWMLGLLAVYLCLSGVLLVALNPALDRQAREPVRSFFTASHLVLAVWTGYGLILLGTRLARKENA